jgi:nucleoside-diphosphate-sugar epimerase
LTINKGVLVISADGVIGSNLTEDLMRNDYNVKAFIQYNSWGCLDLCLKDVKGVFKIVACDEFRFYKFLRKIVIFFNSNLDLISK